MLMGLHVEWRKHCEGGEEVLQGIQFAPKGGGGQGGWPPAGPNTAEGVVELVQLRPVDGEHFEVEED